MRRWLKLLWLNLWTCQEIIESRTHGGKVYWSYTGRRIWRFIPWVVWHHPGVTLAILASITFGAVAFWLGWSTIFNRAGALTIFAAVFFDLRVRQGFQSTMDHEMALGLFKETDTRALATAERVLERGSRVRGSVGLPPPQFPAYLHRERPKVTWPFNLTEALLVTIGTFQIMLGDWAICSLQTGSLNTCSS